MKHLSRRDVILSGAAAATGFGLSGPLRIVEPALAQATAGPDKPFHKYTVGTLKCTAIYDGIWEKPHDPTFIKNASIEDVKGAMRKAGLTDAFVSIPFTVLVVDTGRDLVMFDAGTGGQVQPTAGKLHVNMAAAGIDAKKITRIVISHFHPDHIFGLMEKVSNVQVFPQAEIIVPEKEMAFWGDAGVFAKLPKARHGLAQRIQANFPKWKNLTQAAVGKEVAPNIRMVSAPGHTPGHAAYHIAAGGAELIYSGDTFYQPALNLTHPDWYGSYDSDGATAEKSRRSLAERIIADKVLVAGYHFPWPAAGTISKDANGYVLVPAKA